MPRVRYAVVGQGYIAQIAVLPAFAHAGRNSELAALVSGDRVKLRAQFAAELLHFSDCVLRDREPEPSGAEGLADVRIIRALLRSARSGRPVRLGPFTRSRRPRLAQEIHRPPVRKPRLVRAQSPSPE